MVGLLKGGWRHVIPGSVLSPWCGRCSLHPLCSAWSCCNTSRSRAASGSESPPAQSQTPSGRKKGKKIIELFFLFLCPRFEYNDTNRDRNNSKNDKETDYKHPENSTSTLHLTPYSTSHHSWPTFPVIMYGSTLHMVCTSFWGPHCAGSLSIWTDVSHHQQPLINWCYFHFAEQNPQRVFGSTMEKNCAADEPIHWLCLRALHPL